MEPSNTETDMTVPVSVVSRTFGVDPVRGACRAWRGVEGGVENKDAGFYFIFFNMFYFSNTVSTMRYW